jgi:hypothetical protein
MNRSRFLDSKEGKSTALVNDPAPDPVAVVPIVGGAREHPQDRTACFATADSGTGPQSIVPARPSVLASADDPQRPAICGYCLVIRTIKTLQSTSENWGLGFRLETNGEFLSLMRQIDVAKRRVPAPSRRSPASTI